MPKAVTIYHNPRCSKSRQTLALLEAKGVTPKVVEYLKTPPSVAELKRILKKLGRKPRDILRKGESVYAELGLKDKNVSDDDLIKLMTANPILITRTDARRARSSILAQISTARSSDQGRYSPRSQS